MLLVLVGEKGAGKTESANYLVKKHGMKIITVEDALEQDIRDGKFIVDGTGEEGQLTKLRDKGGTIWIVRKPKEPATWDGMDITVKVDNFGTLEELHTVVEQRLWGCC